LGLKAHGHKRFTDQQLIDLHEKGLNDREKAEKLGVTPSSVSYRRRKLGLKGHDPKLLFTDQQLIDLHEKGLNDQEKAEELCVSKPAVNYRRRRLGLEAHGHKLLFTDQQLIDLHERGLNGREIAEKLGVTPSAVNYRRRKLSLKSVSRARKAKMQRYKVYHRHNPSVFVMVNNKGYFPLEIKSKAIKSSDLFDQSEWSKLAVRRVDK
ncbi:unnamed protein product, partial [marine sediment metagenome]